MTQKSPNPWNVAIIGGAIAGVLTTVILALFSSAREWLTYSTKYSNLEIVLFSVIPLVLGVTGGIWLSRRSVVVVEPQAGREAPEQEKVPELDDVDHHVVRGLISFDGEWASVDELSVRVGRPKLIVERSLEKLVSRGYTKDLLAVGRETLYKLSSSGTTYAIDNGLNRVSR
jgi:hypothetical protein